MRKNKKKLYHSIASQTIDGILSSGLTILFLYFGIDYFNMRDKWTEFINLISNQFGHGIASDPDMNLLLSVLANNFPFNLISTPAHSLYVLYIGIVITVLGIILVVLSSRTKDEFWTEIGKCLYQPAIIGLIFIIIIQIFTIFTITSANLQNVDLNVIAQNLQVFNSGLKVWYMLGSVFIIGISSLLIGSVVRYIMKVQQIRNAFFKILFNAMVHFGYICVGYYLFLRIINMSFIAETTLGAVLSIFSFTTVFSTNGMIFGSAMLTLGLEINKYGKFLAKQKKSKQQYDG